MEELEDYKEVIARVATHGDIHTLMEVHRLLRERSESLIEEYNTAEAKATQEFLYGS